MPAPPAPVSPPSRRTIRWRTLSRLAPGVVTGAADVDPALILTATVAGAAFGYSLLWVVLLCVPFLVTVFSVSGRIGYETRKGLVDLLRGHYGASVALLCALVVIAINMAMIVADLMAVSDAFSIVLNQPRAFFVTAVAFSVWYVLIFADYRKVTRVLLWLSLPLFIYVAAAIFASPSARQVLLGTFVPHVPRKSAYVGALIAIMGSLLTPYILVWQTSSRREHATTGQDKPHKAEPHTGTFVTTVLAYSVMVAAASVLRLPQASNMTTAQAAEALRPAVGELGQLLFALGIIGAGLVALPILVASMCYSIAEAMDWKAGLSQRPWEAKRFYMLISSAMLIAVGVNFASFNPVTALFWSQILAGALTVPILIFILLLSNDRRIMHTTNTVGQNFWIGAAAGGLVASGAVWVWWKLTGT
jgi:Mn2+/Fe2+ NRAMP family transporter